MIAVATIQQFCALTVSKKGIMKAIDTLKWIVTEGYAIAEIPML